MTALDHPSVTGAVRLRDLDTAELVIVSTLRLWIAAVCGPLRHDTANWYDGLAAAGVTEQPAMAFHEMMEAIVAGVSGPLDFRPRPCRHLGRDESRVLDLLRLLQHNCRCEAAQLLTGWMPAASRRVTGNLALRLAEGLRQAGLILPPRSGKHAGATVTPGQPHAAMRSPDTLH
jgi:hypothetical protein